ncbi:hypothetical protein [Ktedonobacter robiniae]|uniref:Uncharacterized protein n=1 Tax=Ktedonobacter robiniae TaxID=2778365 RepID=A0ABQ3V0D8_9CHLR|nr:hypothetical protein [Ktedonobacter robiniae]GHO58483.1 hypothetical protein KSB_69580 [Ktedonobacter robiniae]
MEKIKKWEDQRAVIPGFAYTGHSKACLHEECAHGIRKQTNTPKEIEKARSERRKQVRAELSTREAMVNQYVEIHHAPPPAPKTVVEPASVEVRPRLKRYIND